MELTPIKAIENYIEVKSDWNDGDYLIEKLNLNYYSLMIPLVARWAIDNLMSKYDSRDVKEACERYLNENEANTVFSQNLLRFVENELYSIAPAYDHIMYDCSIHTVDEITIIKNGHVMNLTYDVQEVIDFLNTEDAWFKYDWPEL